MNQWSKRMDQFKTAFLHLKIQHRLLLSYAVVVVVPLLLLTICINWVLSDSLSKKSLQRMDQETEIISKNIEMFVSEIQSYGKLLSVNQSLQWILTHPTQRTTAERFLAERKVRQESGYYSVVINRAVRYELYDALANRVLKREEESFRADAIAEIIDAKKEQHSYWFVAAKTEDAPTDLYVCSLRRVIDENTGYTIGTLLTYTKESSLRSAYAYDDYPNGELVLVLDENVCAANGVYAQCQNRKPDCGLRADSGRSLRKRNAEHNA